MKNATDLILKFNARLSPKMQALKFKALQENPVRFYRGTCHLFYQHFFETNKIKDTTKAWICGDLHLENFGSFKGNNRLVYFDVNDFDEAVLAPITSEITRLTTSILVASSMLQCSQKEAIQLAAHALTVYVATILSGKAMMVERETTSGIMKTFFEQVMTRNRNEFISTHTTKKEKKILIKIDSIRTNKLDKKSKKQLTQTLQKQFSENKFLSNYKMEDVAIRTAGTGSIGFERYMVLVKNERTKKYYVLDMKEAKSSSLLSNLSTKQPKWENDATRILTIQNRLQFCSPALLSSIAFNKKYFVLKELQPLQDKVDFSLYNGNFGKLKEVIEPMAKLTAYAHLRASGRQNSSTADELAKQVSEKKWQKGILDLSKKLSNKMLADYEEFRKYKVN